jgi:hypothetical protein
MKKRTSRLQERQEKKPKRNADNRTKLVRRFELVAAVFSSMRRPLAAPAALLTPPYIDEGEKVQ